ncbi:Uma2 family endonuclease [Nocardia vaccinii]|uniref:Uma2 family endonuclease n=1 Tax=Nocardia vaccinii TaxID=1822 RepID=UPI000A735C2A|nr:Uma2 family endonuclease [Nocardia vaccinii]
MSIRHHARPDLPSTMTWEELELLPEEIAGQIELWEGRVVWARRGPAEHRDCTVEFRNALRRCARADMAERPDRCWRVSVETNIFLGDTGKSDFLTPDFLVYGCLQERYQDIRASDVQLVGEVLSPSNTPRDVEMKKTRYANAGIPWYWEVLLGRGEHPTTTVRAFGLETGHGRLPEDVTPLRRANYIIAGEWMSGPPETEDLEDGLDPGEFDSDGITFDFPFPIRIPWSELEY